MKWMEHQSARIATIVVGAAVCLTVATPRASGELHWQNQKKEALKIRLIALAFSYPRSSFFPSDEVFIAEDEFEKNETRLVKLVYDFLPYQPPLSESGLDYFVVHEMSAVRDPSCDESMSHMASEMVSDPTPEGEHPMWKYSAEAPNIDVDHRNAALRCYRTSAQDYNRQVRAPIEREPERPVLSHR
ncbi:MAG TPA: hypothetical protein VFA68_18895 [Terriglobales bacterium]|nr:hypothetical protein [Terriglobales bacterium]